MIARMQVDGMKGSGRNRGVMKDSATRVKLMTNALVNQMAIANLVMELGVGMKKEILRALQLPVSKVFKRIFTRYLFNIAECFESKIIRYSISVDTTGELEAKVADLEEKMARLERCVAPLQCDEDLN